MQCFTFIVAFAFFNTCIPCCELTALVGFFGGFVFKASITKYRFPMLISKFTVTW